MIELRLQSPKPQALSPCRSSLPSSSLGLGAIAVPILVHLIQRERKRVVEFPSLMFVQRIPYQSVRRRRIRHWFLLLMRARGDRADRARRSRGRSSRRAPRPRRPPAAPARSSSCSISPRAWATAITGSARATPRTRVVARSAPTTRRRWCCSAGTPKRTCARPPTAAGSRRRSTRRRSTSDATRYGPALKLAESILSRSTLQRREAMLITDFQKSRLERRRGRALPRRHDADAGVGRVATTANISVPSVTFARAAFSGQERITVTAGVTNKGAEPATNVPVVARDRRPSRSRRRRATIGAERVGVGDLRAVHARRAERARHRARRHRSAAGRQHVPFRAHAERAGVGARRRQRRPRRRRASILTKALGDRHDAGVPGRSRAGRARDARDRSTSARSSS